MGTLLWQLNDCWPATSWSIIDASQKPKAAWFAVREAYNEDAKNEVDSIYPKKYKLEKPILKLKKINNNSFSITSNKDAKFVFLSFKDIPLNIDNNYFDLKKGEIKTIFFNDKNKLVNTSSLEKIDIISLFDVIKTD
jgi:beta-mannosidase